MAKRILLKTKKAIQGRIRYKKNKVKKLALELSKYSDRDEKKKIKFGKGKKSHKTIHNILSNEILNINKQINREGKKFKLIPKLKKFTDVSRKGLKKGDRLVRLGNLWNREKLEDRLDNSKIKVVNGFKKSTQYPEISNAIDQMFINAYDKYAQIILIENNITGVATVYLTGAKPDQVYKKD